MIGYLALQCWDAPEFDRQLDKLSRVWQNHRQTGRSVPSGALMLRSQSATCETREWLGIRIPLQTFPRISSRRTQYSGRHWPGSQVLLPSRTQHQRSPRAVQGRESQGMRRGICHTPCPDKLLWKGGDVRKPRTETSATQQCPHGH
jgi:hypothetical protein